MDINYFNTIDDPNKAYWLGFIWCDGYVGKTHSHSDTKWDYSFKLDLSGDKEHVTLLKERLGIETPIKEYTKHYTGYSSHTNTYRVACYKKDFVESLLNIGVVANRYDSTTITNMIPKEYQKDFLRGLLDADGSFTYYITNNRGYRSKKYTISFGGSEILLDYVRNVLVEYHLIDDYSYKLSQRYADRDSIWKELRICGKQHFVDILSWLYDTNNDKLKRKHEKYLNYMDIIKGGDVNVN